MIGRNWTRAAAGFVGLLAAFSLVIGPAAVQAAPEVGFGPEDITISLEGSRLQTGEPLRIYVRVHNAGSADARPMVRLSVNGEEIGTTEPVKVRAHAVGDTWFDWQVPAEPFAITAQLQNTGGDTFTNNDRAVSRQFTPVPERDIFTPPGERASTTVPVPPIPIYEGLSTEGTSTPPLAATTSRRAAPVVPAAANPPSLFVWLPYLLILVGAVGFAWALRYRQKQPLPRRTLDLRAAPTVVRLKPTLQPSPPAKKVARPAAAKRTIAKPVKPA